MLNLSNILSFSRAPLALLFLLESPTLRIIAIVLAMLTDSIDGYLARRTKTASQFGAILDPAMDKFFVTFALFAFLAEGRIETWQAFAMLARDFSLCLFGIYLTVSGYWQTFQFRAVRWGKITTALQFIILIALTLNVQIPWQLFGSFVVLGALAFIELYRQRKSEAKPST